MYLTAKLFDHQLQLLFKLEVKEVYVFRVSTTTKS
jgi:hypothetical protein